MEDIAAWVAPAATMIAAIVTAANLGPRATGWGFVIFTIGALAWCWEAWATHQPNLLWSNACLALVDMVGIYRWLGRRARLEDGAQRAAFRSRRAGRPLFPLHSLEGQPISGPDGFVIAHVVGAMGQCANGRIAYLVVRRGGIAERDQLRAIAWRDIIACDPLQTRLQEDDLAASPPVAPEEWPVKVEHGRSQDGGLNKRSAG